MRKPTLHLMVGLPCSGKTTAACQLAIHEGALLLTPDVWQIRLFGQDAAHPEHDLRHSAIEAIQWELARDALRLGQSVILDFGFWAKEERDCFRREAQAMDVGFRIHFMDIPPKELFRRLEARNAARSPDTFIIAPEALECWIGQFQPPDAEELRASDAGE